MLDKLFSPAISYTQHAEDGMFHLTSKADAKTLESIGLPPEWCKFTLNRHDDVLEALSQHGYSLETIPIAKFTLHRERLNQGGYTTGGRYFGVGQPLYFYSDDDGLLCDYIRADDRQHAKEIIRAKYPHAKFYR